MAVNTTIQVVMPQMGESVTEGTVLSWFKQEGEEIAADEPLVEISTDKIDAEVPSPGAGTLVKLHVAEGDTVTVGQVLAEIAPTQRRERGARQRFGQRRFRRRAGSSRDRRRRR